jgi:triacylglycerol lipase
VNSGTIVLAHGVLGFGSLVGAPSFVSYFNGVAMHLRRRGHTVITPQVNPIGSVKQRGTMLASLILKQAPAKERVHIIAHSMGGLDARHAITKIGGFAERVATLVTIGTPHRGSPVADAIANRTGPLISKIPAFLKEKLESNVGALHDLTTEIGIHFDETTPDVGGVRYIDVAGDASKGGRKLFLFKLAAEIGRINGEVNDGVVTRSSALRAGHKNLDDWPVDHAGEVGWSFDSPVPIVAGIPLVRTPAHLLRYDEIVKEF